MAFQPGAAQVDDFAAFDPNQVYRGIAGGLLPDNFWVRNEFNVRGGVEFAFMSTTTNRDVAMEYAAASGKQARSHRPTRITRCSSESRRTRNTYA